MKHYILVNEQPQLETDLVKWNQWMLSERKSVAYSIIYDSIIVSTAFLGVEYSFDNGLPILFETVVYANTEFLYEDKLFKRYTTMELAKQGHNEIVEIVKNEFPIDEVSDFQIDLWQILHSKGIKLNKD